jgi:hypothetical protein
MPSSGDESQSDDGDSPVDAFAIVGNDIRAAIIRALGDARVERGVPPVLSFSELRSRTDADVGSSQFNYHLKQLLGRYVESLADGYQMRAEGRRLYGMIRAGTFEESDAVRGIDAGFACHYCGADVTATVEKSMVSVECPACAYTYGYSGAPPGAVAGESAALDRVAAFYHHRHLAFARGVCVTCGSELDTELLDAETAPYADADRRALSVYRSCAHCGDQRHLTLGTALLLDPDVVSFCHECGVDVFSTPLWELEFAATDRGVTVQSTDPWMVSLTIEFDGDALTLLVDGDLNVVERTRS